MTETDQTRSLPLLLPLLAPGLQNLLSMVPLTATYREHVEKRVIQSSIIQSRHCCMSALMTIRHQAVVGTHTTPSADLLCGQISGSLPDLVPP
jgi:hypothetical protein